MVHSDCGGSMAGNKEPLSTFNRCVEFHFEGWSGIGWLALVGLCAVQAGGQRKWVKGRFRSESIFATILFTPGMCVAEKVNWMEMFCVVSAAVRQPAYCSVLSRKCLTTLQAKVLVPAPWLQYPMMPNLKELSTFEDYCQIVSSWPNVNGHSLGGYRLSLYITAQRCGRNFLLLVRI